VRVNPTTLDIMLTWDKSGGYEVQEIDNATSGNDEDWMARLLQANVFSRIPPSNIQLVFMRMATHHFKAGEEVIRQGDDGDKFFIIREGKCEVTRKTRKNPEGISLATLGPGDIFGEESLISGGKRNASIHMVTDGVLMSLSKADFLELLNDPVLSWVTYHDAHSLLSNGAIWLDVRLPAEYEQKHIRKSVNIPLPLIRTKASKLDPKLKYLVYCDSGRRSSIAAYLLTQRGIQASILKDSLETIPAADLE
jgi:rhodanese-related sulfurtransferase